VAQAAGVKGLTVTSSTPQDRLGDHELIRLLRNLDLDPDHFVIFGSAPLLAHGLRTNVSDLDVVARGDVLKQVATEGNPAVATYSGDQVWQYYDGKIQFSEQWIRFGQVEWNTDTLIDNATTIGGLRFAHLEDVLAYKRELRRPKDEADIEALEKHIEANRTRT
jgi:hypothetical protein